MLSKLGKNYTDFAPFSYVSPRSIIRKPCLFLKIKSKWKRKKAFVVIRAIREFYSELLPVVRPAAFYKLRSTVLSPIDDIFFTGAVL